MIEQKLEVKNTSKATYVQPCVRISSCDQDVVTTSGEVEWLTSWNGSFEQNHGNTFIKGVD